MDVLDQATSEMALGSEPGIDAAKKLPGEGFKDFSACDPDEGPRQEAVGGRISTIWASGSPAGLESVLRRP